MPIQPHPCDDAAYAAEQHEVAAAKAEALVGVLTSIAVGWPGWEPTLHLLLATAGLAASVARHLDMERTA